VNRLSKSFLSRGYFLGALLALTGASISFVSSPTPGQIYGLDDTYYFIYLPSLVVDGDLDFANQIEAFRSRRPDAVLNRVPVGADGRVVNWYGIGYALLSLPFFLLGFPITFLARLFGVPWDYDGMNPLFQFSTSIASIAWGFTGLELCRRILLRHFPTVSAERSLALVLLATPLVYYMFMTPTMAHATAFFSVALWLYLWDPRQPQLPIGRAMALGAAGALTFLVRYPNVLVWVGALVDFPRWKKERPEGGRLGHRLRFWAIAAITFAVCVLPQLLIWRLFFGQMVVHPYPTLSKKVALASVMDLWMVLFSDLRGVFNWHPILLLSVAGLIFALRERRWLALHSLLVVGGLVYVYAAHNLRTFGVAFGSRVFVDALPFFGVGLAALLIPGRWMGARWTTCVALVLVNLAVAVAYRSHAIPDVGTVSWPERLAAVAEVPDRLVARFQGTWSRLKSP